MLTIQNLSKAFRKRIVLKNLSLEFKHGIYGILGPNGAGKTTLLRCITTLYPCEKNIIQYDEKSIQNNSDYLQRLGYLPQKFGLLQELSVKEALQLLWNLKGLSPSQMEESITKTLELVNLSDRTSSKVKTLSGGMIRRLGIAQALLGDPEILVFDEPTAGLDPEERLRFQNIITQLSREKIVLLSTHIVTDVESLCDTIVVMNDGNVVLQGTCDEIAAAAKGKVYLVPEKQKSEIKGEYYVQQTLQRDGEKLLKILTANAQDFSLTSPEIEDGYICSIKQI